VNIELTPLPFEPSALEPVISEQTVRLHHGGHQATYVNNLNKLLEGDTRSLIEVIDDGDGAIFNNAAQVWNHEFLWNSLTPKASNPSPVLAEVLAASFGSTEALVAGLIQAGTTQFGSGWAWLVNDGSSLQITTTGNAELPNISNCQPLLTIDLWEHAYYLDYQNRRPEYLEAILHNLINWQQAEDLLLPKPVKTTRN